MNELFYFLKESQKLVEIYKNTEKTDAFILGIICSFDDEFLLVKCFDKYGEYDGYLAIETDCVYRISYDSLYTKKLQSAIDESMLNTDDILFVGENIIQSLLSRKELLAISLCDSDLDDIYGYVQNIKKDIVIVDCVDENNEVDGVTAVGIKCISVIEFDSKKLRFISKNVQ